MVVALERFLNWQMDMDWSWGPLLPLRPARNVRLTLLFWLRLSGAVILFAALLGTLSGVLLLYYDSASARHHETKIAPVVATEAWMNRTPPGTLLFYTALAMALVFVGCFPLHWAWNRRADRLNREAGLPQPPPTVVPGVWPPPPNASASADTPSRI